MKVNKVLNHNTQATTFGYNLPKYCDYAEKIWTEEFIESVCKKKQAISQAAYEEYMQALKSFKEQRFDASKLDQIYRPQIEKLSEFDISSYDDFIKQLKPPVYNVIEKQQRTRDVKTPFKNFLNCLMGKPKQVKTVTETVNVITPHQDLSKIDATVDGVEFVRYGSIFTGDNPARDFFEIRVKSGYAPITMAQFADSPYIDSEQRADRYLQQILSSANQLNKFKDKITQKLEEQFISFVDFRKNSYQKQLEYDKKMRTMGLCSK